MGTQATWAILEGGLSQTFPLSINQSTDWTTLRRGECYSQDNTSHERGGVLAFASPPVASTKFFCKTFIDPVTPDTAPSATTATRYWAYGRWWRISLNPANPYRLEYTSFGQEAATTFVVSGNLDFNEDGNDRIVMIATSGDGDFFVLKPTCAYVLSNANGDATSFRKTAAYYGMGCSNPGSSVSNAVIAGNVASTWYGGDASTRVRHWMWDGRNGATELSRNVRDLAALQPNTTIAKIDWAQNLIICGTLVYDVDNKRIFYYSGSAAAGVITRPYFHVHYHPIVLTKLAFICNGASGKFECTIEYGQAQDALNKSKKFSVVITPATKQRFRHIWTLDRTILCRVYRLNITNLSGIGLTQIEALSAVSDSPDSDDGTQ